MRLGPTAVLLATRAFTRYTPLSTIAIHLMAPTVIHRLFSSGKPVVFRIDNVTDFQEHVMNSSTPVLVDFYADWCGPCKLLGPRLEEKVINRGGEVLMAKVNVDDAGELAAEMDISAVPTVMAFNNGECIAQFKGDISDEELDHFIDKAVEVR